MIEKFGINQASIEDAQWLQVNNIGNQLKSSPYIKYKYQRYIAEAEHQSKRFQNIAYLSGVVLFLAFLKFPLVRVQPGFQRVGISAAMTYPLYSFMAGLGEKLKVKRIKYAYRKNLVDNDLHERITI